MLTKQLAVLTFVIALATPGAFAQQIDITRINAMPLSPSPFEMRDWKEVARAYDRFVFDLDRSGQHLPLIRLRTNTVNYPARASFGLHTYVGTLHPASGEAINVLPALVGASLVDIDKSSQAGSNWVLMAQEYFNRRPEENVYLNHPVTSSGGDWWYDTMPNVFFYQLFDLYPPMGDAEAQFTSVADRWLEAVRLMGGGTAPWRVPWMRYRGWHLATMTPNRTGVVQPEAAGALAWILYNAYTRTGRLEYRTGAEWAMEYLNSLTSNPSYELQLAYGAYIAARMNAEIGTDYDVQKLVNWCFTVGPLRSWGAIVGNWGGYDVSGLIGEVSGNDYAFAMNTFQQVGALVPLVRYDPRFARAIGRWVLNASNASRLFYSGYLPPQHQDAAAWAGAHDPGSVIAYEAIRRTRNNLSPFATGDATGGGWAQTNLALYGSSHVGYLAAIVDTTNVPMILRLDLLKTDFFRNAAYPSFLFFNPYDDARNIEIDVGPSLRDVYDAVSRSFIATSAIGEVTVPVPPREARLLVYVPAGGTVEYDAYGRMHVDGVIVDYRAREPETPRPRVKGIGMAPSVPVVGAEVALHCTATGEIDAYTWSVGDGEVSGTGPVVQWKVPATPGLVAVTCTVRDRLGTEISETVHLTVSAEPVPIPEITLLTARPRKVHLGATSAFRCEVEDPAGSPVVLTWFARGGEIMPTGDATAVWTAPDARGDYHVGCTATNDRGGSSSDSLLMPVRNLSTTPSGSLVAWFPFDGSALDAGPNALHGTVRGATLTSDREGRTQHAYQFNGTTASILVPNSPVLNFVDGISVALWFRPEVVSSQEAFLVSHGSWQNRWKLSIADGRLRWTIRTGRGVVDLDSPERLVAGAYYHAVATYDGEDVELYLAGELASFAGWTGSLTITTHGLTIGQMLPSDNTYNFAGVIDEVRLYDYALGEEAVQGVFTSIEDEPGPGDLDQHLLAFPNPSTGTVRIQFGLDAASNAELTVFNLLGQLVTPLSSGPLPVGLHEVEWNGRDAAGVLVRPGVYMVRLRTTGSVRTATIVRL
jgi:hypothetical protein